MEYKLQNSAVELHNVDELEPAEGMSGVWLMRYPMDVRVKLGEGMGHEGGRFASQMPTGCEIRFVTTSKVIRIMLSLAYFDGDIIIYNGDFVHSAHHLEAGRMMTLHLEKNPVLCEVKGEALNSGRFPINVWRIMFSGRSASQAILHEIDGFGHEVRSPLPEEKPSTTWLAYGSSITNGSGALHHHNAYIQQAARRLGVDILNKGLGGSCLIEKTTSDYLSGLAGWDFATLELGVNMRNQFTVAEFEERAGYLVEMITAKNPHKPIVLITIYPNFASHLKQPNQASAHDESFNAIIRSIHRQSKHTNLYLVEGSEIVTDFSYLTTDLIHPSDFGHMMMGQHLAELLHTKNIGVI